MSTTLVPSPIIATITSLGPVSRRRQRRVMAIYVLSVAAGLLTWILDASPFWRAAGLGMAFPGAGFLAVVGWPMLLMPVALLLFAVALFVWFACGMVLLPPLVWLGAAAGAGLAAGDGPLWAGAPWLTATLVIAWRIRTVIKRRKALTSEVKKRDERNAYLPQAMVDVKQRAIPRPTPDAHELSPEDIAHSRLILERALQPVGELKGYNRIDQFQTAALRYQVNFLGYGLGMMQSQYTPNFHGYLSEAQRRVIDQYLQRPVWDYWRLENLWGKFKCDPNPIDVDNIMMTAYFGEQVGLYMLSTGDMRYAAPGSLTFRWNEHVAFEHDIHSLNASLIANFRRSPFCLYPCEPNWIYTGCNFFGLRSLAVYDRIFGSHHLDDIKQPFLDSLDREFTTLSGSVIALRSSLTGFTAPFPGGDAGAVQAMNLLSPERARRYWAMARNDMRPLIREEEGIRKFKLPGKGLDFGNYGRGFTMIYGGLLMPAREIGDAEFSEALLNSLNLDCGRRIDDGVLSYAGSNLANSTAFLGRLTQVDGRREALMVGPPAASLCGPVLTGANFPEVLVAKARSHGDDLDLVLYPGKGPGPHTIKLERLKPGRAYAIGSDGASRFTADANGVASLTVRLDGRTALTIQPLAGGH